jgi:hypothetical protein
MKHAVKRIHFVASSGLPTSAGTGLQEVRA